jgi:hypothetical protein
MAMHSSDPQLKPCAGQWALARACACTGREASQGMKRQKSASGCWLCLALALSSGHVLVKSTLTCACACTGREVRRDLHQGVVAGAILLAMHRFVLVSGHSRVPVHAPGER